MSGSSVLVAARARLLRQTVTNRCVAQLHRMWLPYELGSAEEGMELVRATRDGLYGESFKVDNKAAGSVVTVENLEERLTGAHAAAKHAHVLESFELSSDMTSFSARITYSMRGADGATRQVPLKYEGSVEHSAKDLLPRLGPIDVSFAGEIAAAEALPAAYLQNRAFSFANAWVSAVEEISSPEAMAAHEPFLRSLVHSDLATTSETGTSWNSADDVVAWHRDIPVRLENSTHVTSGLRVLDELPLDAPAAPEGCTLFGVDLHFDWEGIARDGTLLEARTHHQWVLVDDPKAAFPKLTRASIKVVVPFHPKA